LLPRASFAQLLCALLAADLNDVRSNGYLDATVVEFAIAGRAGFFSHENLLSKPTIWALIGDHPAAAAAVEIFSRF
jgi:hypothetical protein